MRLKAKELIAKARTTAATLPPAEAKLMNEMADRIDIQYAALCEALKHKEHLTAENLASRDIIERLIGQYSAAGLHAIQNSLNPGQALLYDAIQVLRSTATELPSECIPVEAQAVTTTSRSNICSKCKVGARDGCSSCAYR
ncbi:hypothetical protein [Vagococcus sp. WN89Y]|uniref:hypothetical protein n=1 Tax=Vagococcus sp. WN89Y TaxID=3457258 RepID=UPI003FCE3274